MLWRVARGRVEVNRKHLPRLWRGQLLQGGLIPPTLLVLFIVIVVIGKKTYPQQLTFNIHKKTSRREQIHAIIFRKKNQICNQGIFMMQLIRVRHPT